MNNEFIFILHAAASVAYTLVSLRLGAEALAASVAVQMLLANLFVVKEMVWFGYHITCSDPFVIGSALSLNLLQEYFGREKAREAIGLSFMTSLFLMIFGLIVVAYVPSQFDTMHPHLQAIFAHTPRIIIASLFVALLVQVVDWALYGIIRERIGTKWLWARNSASLLFTQALDTILFSFLGLYGIVHNIWDIVLISFLVKMCTIVIAGPAIELSRFIVKRK